jgi:hypothetical protein
MGSTTLSIMTLGITTFSILTLSILGLLTTFSVNDTQHNNTAINYAECRVKFNVILNVIMLSDENTLS